MNAQCRVPTNVSVWEGKVGDSTSGDGLRIHLAWDSRRQVLHSDILSSSNFDFWEERERASAPIDGK